jgi:hypothetical protein
MSIYYDDTVPCGTDEDFERMQQGDPDTLLFAIILSVPLALVIADTTKPGIMTLWQGIAIAASLYAVTLTAYLIPSPEVMAFVIIDGAGAVVTFFLFKPAPAAGITAVIVWVTWATVRLLRWLLVNNCQSLLAPAPSEQALVLGISTALVIAGYAQGESATLGHAQGLALGSALAFIGVVAVFTQLPTVLKGILYATALTCSGLFFFFRWEDVVFFTFAVGVCLMLVTIITRHSNAAVTESPLEIQPTQEVFQYAYGESITPAATVPPPSQIPPIPPLSGYHDYKIKHQPKPAKLRASAGHHRPATRRRLPSRVRGIKL